MNTVVMKKYKEYYKWTKDRENCLQWQHPVLHYSSTEFKVKI